MDENVRRALEDFYPEEVKERLREAGADADLLIRATENLARAVALNGAQGATEELEAYRRTVLHLAAAQDARFRQVATQFALRLVALLDAIIVR